MEDKRPTRHDSADGRLILGSRTLSILGVEDQSHIHVLNPWQRGGAETYITDFIILSGDAPKHLIAKSCVKMMPADTVAEWLDRRNVLESNGVNVTDVIAVDGATMIEEFIPYSFMETYRHADMERRDLLKARYIDTYKRVCGAGFSPRSLHDVRSHGDDVIVVDYGEDLGGFIHIDNCDLSIIIEAERSFRSMIR